MTHATPRHPASRCLAGRRRLLKARPPGGQPTRKSTRNASASCLALLGRPPPALESPPSRRAANAQIHTQRPKAGWESGAVPLEPEACAVGMRIASREAPRIPSPYGSGFPAAAGAIEVHASHAAAEGRAACMPHATPRHPASRCLAGRRRLLKARPPGGQPTRPTARSGRRPRRVHSTRNASPPTRLGSTPRRAAAGRSPAAATVARRCDRPAVRRTLGVRRDGPRLSGPWMARQP
jgi:hypothetical protein